MGQRCVEQVAEYWRGWNLIFRFHCEELIYPKGLHADASLLALRWRWRYYRRVTNCEFYGKTGAYADAY